jgi:hypothetical protein
VLFCPGTVGKASLDTTNVKDPVVGVVFGNKGLMYNLTLEGHKWGIIHFKGITNRGRKNT